jgi:hypothetical protein
MPFPISITRGRILERLEGDDATAKAEGSDPARPIAVARADIEDDVDTLLREQLGASEVREVPRFVRDHFDADPPEERPDEPERSHQRFDTILVWRPR